MMKVKILILGVVVTILLFSCSSNKPSAVVESPESAVFNGEWKLKDCWVFDSTLVFQRIDETVERPEYEEVFIIENTDFTHSIRTELGLCGNGMFYLDSARFEMNNKNVHLELNGGYMIESQFIYSADYTVKERNTDRFVLVLNQVNLHKSSSIYD